MTKVTLVRGAFLNPFELQSYYPLAKKYDIKVVSSKHPINGQIKLPLVKLWSLTDLPNFPYKFQILNRIFQDAHYLKGFDDAVYGSDIAHVAESYYHYTLQAIKAKEKGYIKKVVSTVWENILHNNESLRGRKQIKEKVLPKIDHFIAITKQAKEVLIAEGVDSKKISVIPAGIDLGRFSPGVYRPMVQNLLYVGRLVPEKGVWELIDAFKQLKTHFPKLKLTVIGVGPLKKEVTDAGIEVKTVPYFGIHKEYQKADIFVFPSKGSKTWQEQFGMVLVEAMACGLPVITTTSGAMKEVCGTAAEYADPGSATDLADKIHKVIVDDKYRRVLRKKSLETAKRYDSKVVAKQIDQVYQQVLR